MRAERKVIDKIVDGLKLHSQRVPEHQEIASPTCHKDLRRRHIVAVLTSVKSATRLGR